MRCLFSPAKGHPAIAHVIFTDTGEIPAGTLQTAMYGVAIGVRYTERGVRQLLDNTIRPIYEARGLLRVAFPKIETAPAKDVDGVTVTIEVTAGPAYTLDHVGYVGADFSRSEWNNLSKLKTNQTVNFDDVKAAQDRIRASLRREGHLDASSQVKRDVDDKEHTVSIQFQIDPGPLYTLAKLEIIGSGHRNRASDSQDVGHRAGPGFQRRISRSFSGARKTGRRVRQSEIHQGRDQHQRGPPHGGCDVILQ